jgi:hypothetical protein
MEVKEGIVLDKEGNPIGPHPRDARDAGFDPANFGARILSFRASNNPLLLLLIPVVLIFALAVIVVGLIVAIPVTILRRFFR